MKRHVLSSILLLSLLRSACGGPAGRHAESQPGDGSRSADVSSEAGKITFTDALGQAFYVDPPARAAAMIGSFADL